MCGMNWVHGNLIPFNRIWGMLPSTSCQVDAERPIRSIDPLGSKMLDSIPGSSDMSIGFDCTFIYDDQSFSIWLRDICYRIAPGTTRSPNTSGFNVAPKLKYIKLKISISPNQMSIIVAYIGPGSLKNHMGLQTYTHKIIQQT